MNVPDAQQLYMAFNGYVAADEDTANAVQYYGFVSRTGQWYILKEDNTITTAPTFRYARGESSYSTNWTARAALSYDYFYNIFNTSI